MCVFIELVMSARGIVMLEHVKDILYNCAFLFSETIGFFIAGQKALNVMNKPRVDRSTPLS